MQVVAGRSPVLVVALGLTLLSCSDRDGKARSLLAVGSRTYTVSESGGTVTVEVVRTGSVKRTASISYATFPLTAVDGSDYVGVSGILTWAKGDRAPKTVDVAILDDSLPESAESFCVHLTNPFHAAVLGASDTAEVTITDDDVCAQPGELDVLFGTGGSITVDTSTGTDWVTGIAVDASHLYLAGRDGAPGDGQWRIEKRDLLTGSPDPLFGSGGIVIHDPGPGTDSVFRMAADIQSLYLAGVDSGGTSGDYRWRIEKRCK